MDRAQAPRPPLCASCRCNEIHFYILAGAPGDGPRCSHHIVTYPHATDCRYYEREAGAD
jgi:hypothetical protein